MMNRTFLPPASLLLVLLLCSPLHAATGNPGNAALADAEYATNMAAHGGNPDMLVARGLLADRKQRRVLLLAEASGLKESDIVEFPLVHTSSSHGYEALAYAYAAPGDIRRALEFIGLPAGRPTDFNALAFWPRGERVIVTVSPRPATASAGRTNDQASAHSDAPWTGPVRMESLIAHVPTRGLMPQDGFVFTGSRVLSNAGGTNGVSLLADASEPHAIISNYNEPASLMELPRQAAQGDVYSTYQANPARLLPEGALLDVVLAPEYTNKTRVAAIALRVHTSGGTGMRNVHCEISGTGIRENGDASRIVAAFKELVDEGRDPCVTVTFDPAMTLETIRAVCAVLLAIEGERGIRVEAPPAGQLYYRAFIPDEKFRKREDRIAQPWELHLPAGTQTVARLIRIGETWKDGVVNPELHPEEFPLATPAALRAKIDELGAGLPVILVFAPGSCTLKELMDYLSPMLPTHSTIHVYQ